jgi:D-alanyl-D-alanine carboxypeptidase
MGRSRALGSVIVLVLGTCTPEVTVAPAPSPVTTVPRPTIEVSPTRSPTRTISTRGTPCFPRHRDGISLRAPAPSTSRGTRELPELVDGKDVSVAVAVGDQLLFDYLGDIQRTPASNQKLLLSMALLEALGPRDRARTVVTAAKLEGEVVRGNVFIQSEGDPTFGKVGYRATLGASGSSINRLAKGIAGLGIERIDGRVIGLRGPVKGDWDAPGWQSFVRHRYVTRPTALSYNGNASEFPEPELQVAAHITHRLERLGVQVTGPPGMHKGPAPVRGERLFEVTSPPLLDQIEILLRDSSNFIAEVLSKRLAARCIDVPATIAKGARAIQRWARGHGIQVIAHDASGLSYDNRVTARGIVALLSHARERPWGDLLLEALPTPGEGTLGRRLTDVRMHAKTGSLFNGTSTLSGWVWLEQVKQWATFSILSQLGPGSRALEDEIVRSLARMDLQPARI